MSWGSPFRGRRAPVLLRFCSGWRSGWRFRKSNLPNGIRLLTPVTLVFFKFKYKKEEMRIFTRYTLFCVAAPNGPRTGARRLKCYTP